MNRRTRLWWWSARLGRTSAQRLGVVAVIVGAWQLVAVAGHIDPIVLPRPLTVLEFLVDHPGTYVSPTVTTCWLALVGLIGGTLLGLTLASFVWLSPFFSGAITPLALIVRSIPIVAMIPVIAQLVGYNSNAVLTATILISFFPTFVLVLSGLRTVSDSTRDVFRAWGAGKATYFWRLALPTALPNLVTAIRISAASCVAGALIAEYLMATNGLGAVFALTIVDFNTTESWGVAIIALIISLCAFEAASVVERVVLQRVR
jgi:ABC-type nitrate/sulfonate/bicarbonate transport system permease component